MKLLRVDMRNGKIAVTDLPEAWKNIGGSGLIAKIMNAEVDPLSDPLGPQNKLIVACGPLAGTMAPQLGRISVGAKSPLTFGIKEANSGGPAGQFLDKLGFRAIIVENGAEKGKTFCLKISRDETVLVPADEYRGLKNYELVKRIHSKYGDKVAILSIGIAGERRYRGASVSFTDIFGDPSRNAARGGLGAAMGSKGLKAIILDASGTGAVSLADGGWFKKAVKSWVHTLSHDISCGLYSKFGTPFAVANSANQGTLPTNNYRSGRPVDFYKISGEAVQEKLLERGGKMHGCMPGCVVKCSIIYPDGQGNRLAAAYEYENIAMLGSNLGIMDLDAIGKLKFMCDDLGVDAIEIGSCLAVASEAGMMKLGDPASAERLLREIEQGTELGSALGNGVVSTAKALKIRRVPAYKGQALPGHDPRAVKGTGVTYVTSPMGADHTAGLTYRIPREKDKQAENSLRSQVQAAVCDTFGYCLNAVPGGQASIYGFFADLMNARYGTCLSADDIVEIGKQTIRDQLKFNESAEFNRSGEPFQDFFRTESLGPTEQVFDIPEHEIVKIWDRLDAFKEPKKVWEVRIPPMPNFLFGAGVIQNMGASAKRLNMKRTMIVSDPIMKRIGRVDEVQEILERTGISSELFLEVEPDPPVELIEKGGRFFKERGCDGVVGLGGGSSLDAAKAIALRVSHPGELVEYESIVGGTAKIKPKLPPVVCIPTTSGTGSEVNPYAVITNKERNIKFMLMSNFLIPKLAVIDPGYCTSMPKTLTRESGIDALAHCIEGYVSLAVPYHPYFESMALYGTKLIGRSLIKAYHNGDDLQARTDMCMAAAYGGIAFSKGLGLGHAITHVLGGHYHIAHGKACTIALLCFVRANKDECREPFSELAFILNRSEDLETALLRLYETLHVSPRLKDYGIPREDLRKIAFYAHRDAVNMATNPTVMNERKILSLLEKVY
jgi:aldehyde:ferredoxin oxidoreductase